MTGLRRLLPLPALLVALAAPGAAGPTAAAPRAAQPLTIGVADQRGDMFTDPHFLALNVHYARFSVSWNALSSGWQTKELDDWLRVARADHVAPLISFDHPRGPHRHRPLPTPGAFAHYFRMFRLRYPWVTDFAAWNEANYCGEPTCHRPELVAAYYRVMRSACRSCNLLGAELLDEPNMGAWVRAFRRALGHDPQIWGLHNYIGANRLQTASTRALLKASSAQLWFTETGGVVARHNHSSIDFPESPAHAALVTRFVFDRLAKLSRRITRVYIYQWDAGPGRNQSWDSGLVGPGPRYALRPAFAVFARAVLASQGRRPAPGAPASDPLPTELIGSLWGPGGPNAPHARGPLAGTVTARDAGTGAIVAARHIAAGQQFSLALPPGSYAVSATVDPPAPPSAASAATCPAVQTALGPFQQVGLLLQCGVPVSLRSGAAATERGL